MNQGIIVALIIAGSVIISALIAIPLTNYQLKKEKERIRRMLPPL